ncbi:MAG: hypothetical protein M1827_000081 [Pycnora praestabilis]|nr:MAG: hypothetical protein M1827_000081 [Pycnora praestabilis]
MSRFFIHTSITRYAEVIVRKYGQPSEQGMMFPSYAVASRCKDFFFLQKPSLKLHEVRVVQLVVDLEKDVTGTFQSILPHIFAVIFPQEYFKIAKTFWQHSGDGISSRRAEFSHRAYEEGLLVEKLEVEDIGPGDQRLCKGPRRYQRKASLDRASVTAITSPETLKDFMSHSHLDGREHAQFVEERFGRNLDLGFVANAKLAIRRRIAGSLTANVDLPEALELKEDAEHTRNILGFSEQDVYLYPTGMSSIFNTHRTLMAARGQMKSICFGFPYIDTLKILEKWGPGCLFYGQGSSEDLDDLEARLSRGEKYLALFCEFPGNPLLKSPNIRRIRSLADSYDFAVVVDETVGNFMNIHVLPYSDVVVSSLTKIFSGDSNVMGGSSVLNPRGHYYDLLRQTLAVEYEDNYWAEDVLFMERNSRDFVSRIERININAEAICGVLRASSRTKSIYYPKFNPTRAFYDQCRTPKGGYGGLLSVTFHTTAEAAMFFDVLETAKGPSLGTNFTLSSPYTLLAHYGELEWAAQFGVEADLVRISVGLEDTAGLVANFERALQETERMAKV